MKDNFEHCLEMLLEHEGGFVNHPKDPGGMTNLGVTKKVYEDFTGRKVTENQMRDLTRDDVAPIYKAKYWNKVSGDELPSGIDWCVFDWAVNSGPSRSAKALQHCVGATADGAIGPRTIAQVRKFNAEDVIENMHAVRQEFYENLRTFDTFGKGWTRRNAETREQALKLID